MRRMSFAEPMLRSVDVTPVAPAALMEAVTHHRSGKQKEDECQDDRKYEASHSESRWLWF